MAEGTRYYKVTLEQLLKLWSKGNCFVYEALKEFGLDAIDIHSMYGSYIDDEVIYICETDGRDIIADGENADPERAMEDYGPEYLSSYIVDDIDDTKLSKLITEYEILIEVLRVNKTDFAAEALVRGVQLDELIDFYDDLPEEVHR